ncbi:hypothetical protein ABZW96_00695 [Nocardia sp. NPDC004168]|uniref:hypothetical protein n=1 Tax=Nocardia sp. NPDC004168 TaxID=3154452 RepID=UPI0033AA35DF
MAVQGHYNHYDDPDEFWDDEPLEPRRTHRPRSAAVPPSTRPESSASSLAPLSQQAVRSDRETQPLAIQYAAGSSLVSMDLDGGFLPVSIDFSSGWRTHVAPHEVSDELMSAYRAAASMRLDRLYSTGRLPSPQEISETAVPDRRKILMVLLETETWEQFSETSSRMLRDAEYQVYGRAETSDRYFAEVVADRTYLRSIKISSSWPGSTDPHQLSDEILRCAQQIRSLRPTFEARRDYSRYTEADLEYHLDRHRERLLDERPI